MRQFASVCLLGHMSPQPLVGYALVGLLLVVQLGSWSMWGKTSGVLLAFVQLGHSSYSLGVLGHLSPQLLEG